MGVTKGHGAHIILENGGADPIAKSFECAACALLSIALVILRTIASDQHNVDLLPLSKTLTRQKGYYQRVY